MKLKGLIELFRAAIPRKSKTFECEWCIGHGGFMVPDPTTVPHGELRPFLKGKRTRVTIEILGDVVRVAPPEWVPGSSADKAKETNAE